MTDYRVPLANAPEALRVGRPPEAGGGGAGPGAAFTFNPPGIPSAEAFGTFSLANYASFTGIPSGEQFGSWGGIPGGGALLTGIPSAEAFGIASSYAQLLLGGIESEEAFGVWGGHPVGVNTGYVVILVGGPLDGESRTVYEPWPRGRHVFEDADDRPWDYVLEPPEQETEPFIMVYGETRAPADAENVDPEYVPTGPKGDPGEQGEIGPQGDQGTPGEGIDLEFPTTLPAGWVRVGDWLEFQGATVESVDFPDASVSGYPHWGCRKQGKQIVFKGVSRWNDPTLDEEARANLVPSFPYPRPGDAYDPGFTSLYSDVGPLVSWLPADAEDEFKYRTGYAVVTWLDEFHAGGIALGGGRIAAGSRAIGWDTCAFSGYDPS